MSATDELLENNRRYAEAFDKAELTSTPAKKVAVLTCMDSRIIPSRILGLAEGDVNIIRNAGGVVTEDAIRSLAISQNLLRTEEIILIHHSDCGMLTFTDQEFADRLEGETGERPEWAAMTFSDLEENLRDSIRRIKESPFIPRTESVRSFVYDVTTGELSEVI
jgi:carbonic anhydrase